MATVVRNEIKLRQEKRKLQKKSKQQDEGEEEKEDEKKEKKFEPRSSMDAHRQHIEKLMKDPDKPVFIPEPPKKKTWRDAPEFVRHVMGSSAGAGSGEFHIYRGLRRREENRTAFIECQAELDELNEEYHQKLAENKAVADEKTAKKRAKRQRQKEKQRMAKNFAKAKKKKEQTDEANEKEQPPSDDEDNVSDEKEEPHFVIGGK